MRTVAPLTLLFLVLPVHAQRSKYEKTIPPEILRRYDPDVVSGKRPKIVTITQAMIFSLRQEPDRGGDYYWLGFEPGELSSAQQEILREWISHGAKVVVWGVNAFNTRVLEHLFGFDDPRTGFIWDMGILNVKRMPGKLSDHQVNTDCTRLSLGFCFMKYPADTVVFAAGDSGDGECVHAGFVPLGSGGVAFVFAPTQWNAPDADRWTLNFRHWILGLPVPGASDKGVSGAPMPRSLVSAKDRVVLKNGDTVSGEIVTGTFTVQTSYATLEFAAKDIAVIELEGGGQNVDGIVLRNNDRLSGVIRPESVTIKLDTGQTTEISMDKVKEIHFRQQ